MKKLDFNLLLTLNVLLTERSVARAAERLMLSPSAMSRALERLRKTTQDPLLIRAGREMVLTPRAIEIREQVALLVYQVENILSPPTLDIQQLQRTFTLRTSEGFVENFGAELLDYINQSAPKVKLRFVNKNDKENRWLREGIVDLEVAVVGKTTGPDMRSRALFDDRFIGVMRKDHQLAQSPITLTQFIQAKHIAISRREQKISPVDQQLQKLGLKRDIKLSVSGYMAALTLVAKTDLIAVVPEKYSQNLRDQLVSFSLPFDIPSITLSLLWHPRMDGDLAHQWLRGCFLAVCGNTNSLSD